MRLSALGDVIHALPVAHALRQALTTAHITWVVEAREQAILEVRRRLIDAKLDVVLDLQGLVKSGLLTGLSGARLRVGFSRRFCRESLNICFTNARVTPPPSARHVVEQYLALLSPLRIEPKEIAFPIAPNVAVERRMSDFLNEQGVKPSDLLIGLNPGAGWLEKCWPLAAHGQLAQRLSMEAGARILLLWGPGEDHLAKAVSESTTIRPIFAPHTTLPELAALLKRCHLVIGSDTGPIHLAAALGVRTIGLYGPTSARRNGPYGGHARAIQSVTGSMAGIPVASVFETALEYVKSEKTMTGSLEARGLINPGGGGPGSFAVSSAGFARAILGGGSPPWTGSSGRDGCRACPPPRKDGGAVGAHPSGRRGGG